MAGEALEKSGKALKMCLKDYEYHLKDHLGNVRTTFTTKPETEVFETSFETVEQPLFDNYAKQNRDVSYARTGTYSSRLSSTDNQLIGLAKSLKVYPGDTVNATAYVRELAGTGGNINNLFTMLAQGFAGAFANTPIGLEGNLNSFSESLYPEVGTGGLMNKDDSDATPKLYLNMLYFDKDMNFITASFARSSSAATTGFEELNLEVVVPKEGYMLIYVSNEEEQANIAYFDDVNVTHKHSKVVQENSYYLFGLEHSVSYQRNYTKRQAFKYNGKEEISDFGLGMIDYGWRFFDPTIARWSAIDNMAEKYYSYSPYHYAGNNPVRNIDIDGNEFTNSAWVYVKQLLDDLDSRVDDLTNKIDGKLQQLLSGVNSRGKSLSDRKKERLQNQIGDLRGKVEGYLSVASGIGELGASDQVYDIQTSNSLNEPGAVAGTGTEVGGAGFDFSTGVFSITLPSSAGSSFIAHELQHAYQFETGKYSVGPELGNQNPFQNFLYDQHDELNAYNQWGALFNGKSYNSVSSLPARYSGVATGPVDATTHPNVGMLLKMSLPDSKQRTTFQSIANGTGHAFRINGKTYYKQR
ncbi:RHS repeat-associated core domain-containing protein [Marivirga lumbricoides]|uniref:RHS repeat-associated core domain-containing protein n=1 Tax=Marivirga lumbricoides TaxID=1046115 RepID=UPI00166F0957